ncbi:MAG: anti-sigma F factor [Ruminococcus sp.]|jgi:stage II sporulation protein AB (anti-sigma F factor)|nr:anti-sigma F factor [Ruminococcus sp.]
MNSLKMIFPAKAENEHLARVAVTAFTASLGVDVSLIAEIKTAVSEAVTNCIVHAYRDKGGDITVILKARDNGTLHIKITDRGCGISDIKQARTPLWTSHPEEERAGLGFAVMESFCDKMTVKSAVGKGTTITLTKKLGQLEN